MVKIKKIMLPAALRSVLTLLILFGLIFLFFSIFIPLIINKAYELSAIDPQKVVEGFKEPLNKLETFFSRFKLSPEGRFSIDKVAAEIISLINISSVTGLFSSVASILGNIAVAVFSVAFITFFLLKDEKLFANAVLALVPDQYIDEIVRVMKSTKKLLVRYFGGIVLEVTGVMLLNWIGFMIIGISFKDSLLMGFIAGIFNIIPYLGPLMGGIFAVLIGLVTHLHLAFYSELLPLLIYIVVVCSLVQVVDNLVFQPLIYSSSIKSHPLEIFIVFLIAGSMGGIIGMIVAIPAYIVIRVVAKEFFNNFKFVRSLTRNI
jgi:predicted PurR-regulated permease PerM